MRPAIFHKKISISIFWGTIAVFGEIFVVLVELVKGNRNKCSVEMDIIQKIIRIKESRITKNQEKWGFNFDHCLRIQHRS